MLNGTGKRTYIASDQLTLEIPTPSLFQGRKLHSTFSGGVAALRPTTCYHALISPLGGLKAVSGTELLGIVLSLGTTVNSSLVPLALRILPLL